MKTNTVLTKPASLMIVKYLWVVVFASFECFIYETHMEVPLEPWGGWRWGPRLLGWRRLLSERNDNSCTYINTDSITYIQHTECLSYLSVLDSLCFLFFWSLSLSFSRSRSLSVFPLSSLPFNLSSRSLCCSRSFSRSLSLCALLRRPGRQKGPFW